MANKNLKKLPRGALRLVAEDCHAFAHTEGEGSTPKLKMTIYSGKAIENHWWWDRLAIDLKGIQFAGNKFPILENHRTDKKIAFMGRPIVDDNGVHVNPDNAKFVDTEESAEFQKLSADGFPYQASMYLKPLVIERVSEGSSVEVNGFKLKGPGTVFRQSQFKEGSVCVFGWDTKTQATAFSRNEEEELEFEEIGTVPADRDLPDTEKKLNKEVNKHMDIKELKEKHPEVFKQVQDAAVQATETKFSAEVKGLGETNTQLSNKVLNLEKADVIRSANELKMQADRIWDEKLVASDVSENLFSKVKPHVVHTRFVKDGVFDVAAFSKAVDDEIADWVTKGATTMVMGSGFHSKEVESSEATKLAKDKKGDEDTTNVLLNIAGQKTEKT